MSNLPILTVVYHETKEHYNLALKTFESMKGNEVLGVVNKFYDDKYPTWVDYVVNKENNLALAWNAGLDRLFERYDYVAVSGLDSLVPDNGFMEYAKEIAPLTDEVGLLSFTACKDFAPTLDKQAELVPVEHGDGSFSFFILSKKAYEKVGGFDTKFDPAYFEDNDYLERLWETGYTPLRHTGMKYFHVVQGTMKMGNESKVNYPDYMQKNLEYFKIKWNKVPEHLPEDITFKN